MGSENRSAEGRGSLPELRPDALRGRGQIVIITDQRFLQFICFLQQQQVRESEGRMKKVAYKGPSHTVTESE